LQCRGGMIKLLDGRISEKLVASGSRLFVEGVVKAVVADIMAKTSHQKGQSVNFVELHDFAKILRVDQITDMLSSIRSMKVVVVLYTLVVARLDLLGPSNVFLQIDRLF